MCVLNLCTLSEFVWGGLFLSVLHASKSLIGFWHRSVGAFSGSGTNETWSMATRVAPPKKSLFLYDLI